MTLEWSQRTGPCATRGTLDWYCVDRWRGAARSARYAGHGRHRHLIRGGRAPPTLRLFAKPANKS